MGAVQEVGDQLLPVQADVDAFELSGLVKLRRSHLKI